MACAATTGTYADVVRFTRAHGTGNDFVVLADLDDRIGLSEAFVRALTDRHRGVGGDGVLRIGPGRGDAHVFMDYRNADGTVVEMCGNGVRVVAKHVVDHGLVDVGEVVVVGTRAGDRHVTVHRGPDGRVATATVDMGTASTEPSRVPFETDAGDLPVHELDIDGVSSTVSVVSMGNPHAVFVVDDVATADVHGIGARLQDHPAFPEQVNVGFAHPVADDAIDLRVFERGVGETASCGTGACAAVVALHRLGHTTDHVSVRLAGGVLDVQIAAEGRVLMTGPAVEVAHGELDPAWLAANLPDRTKVTA